MIDTFESSCPYLTKDAKGNMVLSWVRKKDSTSFVYCYAVSADGGSSFGDAIEIPSTASVYPHAENLPKIVCKPSGEMIAVWGANNPNPENAYSGLVYYCQSFDNGKTWSSATRLVKDTAGYDQRYFDVALLPNGEAGIIWLDNRKKTIKEGSAMYFAQTRGNGGFTNEKLITEPCCECCRTDLFIDSKKNIHVLYRAIIADSVRDMVHSVSADGGNRFTEPVKISNDNWVINGCPHTGPAITENKEGLHFAWFTAGAGTGVFYNRSKDNGKTFSEKDSLSSRSGRHPQLTNLPNDEIAVVWDESFPSGKTSVSKIGFELKTAEGDKIAKEHFTNTNGSSTFPVLQAIDNNRIIVAYTTNNKGKNNVFYSVITIN